jgi:hypothetical protein
MTNSSKFGVSQTPFFASGMSFRQSRTASEEKIVEEMTIDEIEEHRVNICYF